MSGGIYLIQDDGGLVEMSEQDYASEDLLQELLAKYPNLLAGDQIDSGEPRRWLLIAREVPLASEEDGAGRWAVDHLFLDQDAIPTIVEVKRSTDTRIRREVVGQMLDYAANAVAYWPIETLRSRFEENSEDPEQDLRELLDDETVSEEFWQRVKTNLQAGKLRLIFVADEIPAELRRVVEFLNQQMDPAEVLAVEIKQYAGGDLKTLVPRVIGQTVEAQQKKAGTVRERRQWTETLFFEELEKKRGAEETDIARKILAWSKEQMPWIDWGRGSQDGAFFPRYAYEGNEVTGFGVIGVWTYGAVEMQFQHMDRKPPFDNISKRSELLNRLNEIPGISISADKLTKRPSFYLSALQDETDLKQFFDVLEWALREVKDWEARAQSR